MLRYREKLPCEFPVFRVAGRVDCPWNAETDVSIALFAVIMGPGFNLLLPLICRR